MGNIRKWTFTVTVEDEVVDHAERRLRKRLEDESFTVHPYETISEPAPTPKHRQHVEGCALELRGGVDGVHYTPCTCPADEPTPEAMEQYQLEQLKHGRLVDNITAAIELKEDN